MSAFKPGRRIFNVSDIHKDLSIQIDSTTLALLIFVFMK